MSLSTINPQPHGTREVVSRHVKRKHARHAVEVIEHAELKARRRHEPPRGYVYRVNPDEDAHEGRRRRVGWPWRVVRVWL